jgi:hypothetical protein
MVSETVYDNEYATILYYPEKGIIHHQWNKFCSGQFFRDMMLGASDYLGVHKGSKWLSDDRNYSVLTEEDSVWGRKVWFPRTIHAGWRHWAMVLPKNQLGTISMNNIVEQYRAAGINAQVFDSVPAAMEWLELQ